MNDGLSEGHNNQSLAYQAKSPSPWRFIGPIEVYWPHRDLLGVSLEQIIHLLLGALERFKAYSREDEDS